MAVGIMPPSQGDDVRRLWRKPSDWKTEFAAAQRGRNLSPRTVETYIWGIDVMLAWAGKNAPWEISADDLLDFMERSPHIVATKVQIITAAKCGHKWAAARGYCELNGVMAVQAPKKPKMKRRPPVSPSVARQLLVSAHTPRELRVVYFGLYAGTRICESAWMDEANDGGDRLRFMGKGNVEREVPIHPELRRVLPQIFSESPPAEPTLAKAMLRLRNRIGALDTMGKPASSHTLRRTCSTTMYKAGVPWEIADSILGHSLPMGDRYIEIGWDRMVGAVDRIDYFADLPTQLELF